MTKVTLEDKVDGKNYTSNLSRLTKHLPKLHNIQRGLPTSPVMIHLSLTNRCNLTCDYCCYGNRDLSQVLDFDRAKSAIEQFSKLGTKGLEITGGGDPSLYPRLDDIVQVGVDNGMDVGLITNGLKLQRFGDFYKNLQWMRISGHGLNYDSDKMEHSMDVTVEQSRFYNPDIDLSSVYIWNKMSEKVMPRVANWVEKHEIPTRVTPDLTLGKESIDEMMEIVRPYADMSRFLFLSDFNVKTDREHDRCYAHLIKPFVFTDGNVYDCPSLALSPDNKLNVNDKFKVTTIEGITDYYSQPSNYRLQDCNFCKYSQMNEFIDDLKKPLKHNNFA